MFKKVKKWLGIEGVKLELILPEKIKETDNAVKGKIRFLSMNEQEINYVKVVIIERFSRGRKDEKMTDEYKLGEIELKQKIKIPKETPVDIDFTLPFELVKSEMDKLEDKNILFSGLVKVAKKLRAVKSQYFIEAEAKASGTALHPFDKKLIEME